MSRETDRIIAAAYMRLGNVRPVIYGIDLGSDHDSTIVAEIRDGQLHIHSISPLPDPRGMRNITPRKT